MGYVTLCCAILLFADQAWEIVDVRKENTRRLSDFRFKVSLELVSDKYIWHLL